MCKKMFLQLSDLHFGTPPNQMEDNLRQRIKVSIIRQLVNHNMEFSGLFVTGDIIYGKTTNKRDAYCEAAKFINTICDVMGIRHNQVYIVPGNHDIDLSNNERNDAILQTRNNYKCTVGEIAASEKRNLIPNDYFLSFYKNVTGRKYQNKHAIRSENRGPIDILCLDSSITCTTTDTDVGKLILGTNDITFELNRRHNKDKPMIVLSHHDPDWLLPNEKKTLINLLVNNAAFIYCCGHVHHAELYSEGGIRDDDRSLPICISPAMMDDGEQADMGYNVICIDTDSKDFKVESYIYKMDGSFEDHILYNNNFDDQGYKLKGLISRKGVRINSCELFLARRKKHLTLAELGFGTDINNSIIQKYEHLQEKYCIDSIDIYPKCDEKHIIKLSHALSVNQKRLLGNKSYYKDETSRMEQYKRHKGLKKYPFPIAKTKIVVFDFDGTLTDKDFQKTSWERMWEACGYSAADCGELAKQYFSGQFTHQEWCDKTAENFIARGFSLKTLADVAKKTRLLTDCNELIENLHKRGIKLFIVSGSVDKLIRMVLGDTLINLFERVQANKMDFDVNGMLERIISTKYDFEGKAEYIKGFFQEKYTPNEIVFFGNSDNDESVHDTGVKTICVNPAQTDRYNTEIWNDYISAKSANDLMKFIDD